jgi:serine/threonine protein kinase
LKYIINKKKTKKNDELYISTKLKNKNIIGLYGYIPIKENNSESFIMEYAKYGNLRNFQIKVFKRPYLSESMLLFFFYQILNGLVYCHRCKIAHMDIKPQNIVIDDFLNAKLIDFSISLNYSDKKPNDTIKLPFKGTNFYMSSEIINSNTISYKNLNKVDAYALGVTLYNLAFGIFPYNLEYGDEQNFKLINEKINGDLKIDNKDNLSPFFIDFVTKLLEKDINKRMSIYEAIQHPWIKGAKILFDEKDNTYNVYSFFINLMTDNIKNFNDYIKKDN